MLDDSKAQGRPNRWQIWIQMQKGVLLDTPEKAVDFAEAVVRARYGQAEVEEERPFVAHDRGERWDVLGTNGGSHTEIPFFRVVSLVSLRKNTGEIINYTLQSSEADAREMRKQLGIRK